MFGVGGGNISLSVSLPLLVAEECRAAEYLPSRRLFMASPAAAAPHRCRCRLVPRVSKEELRRSVRDDAEETRLDSSCGGAAEEYIYPLFANTRLTTP